MLLVFLVVVMLLEVLWLEEYVFCLDYLVMLGYGWDCFEV